MIALTFYDDHDGERLRAMRRALRARVSPARHTDPPTSHAAAQSRALRVRAGSQQAALLTAYADAGDYGLTNDGAGVLTGLASRPGCCYWKRCGELLQHGYLADTGVEIRSQVGEMQRVCRVTDKGLAAISGGAE